VTFIVPCWWNDQPNSTQAAEFLAILKKQLKTHLFHLTLSILLDLYYSVKKKKKKNLHVLLFVLLLLFSSFVSWIKASAKWLNVNIVLLGKGTM